MVSIPAYIKRYRNSLTGITGQIQKRSTAGANEWGARHGRTSAWRRDRWPGEELQPKLARTIPQALQTIGIGGFGGICQYPVLGEGWDSGKDGGELLNHGLAGVGTDPQGLFVLADLGIGPLEVLNRSLRRIREVLNGIAPVTKGEDWAVGTGHRKG